MDVVLSILMVAIGFVGGRLYQRDLSRRALQQSADIAWLLEQQRAHYAKEREP